jgi:putative membrane protein
MMGYGYRGGSWMMWGFGGVMMVGLLVLIGVLAWSVITATGLVHPGHSSADLFTEDAAGRGRAREILEERYARGEITTDEYTEHLHNLAR